VADFSAVPRATAPRYHVKTGISISSVHVRLLVQKLPKRNFTNSRVGTATDYVDMRASFFYRPDAFPDAQPTASKH